MFVMKGNKIYKKKRNMSKELYGMKCPHCDVSFFISKVEIGNPYNKSYQMISCPECNRALSIRFNLNNNIDVSPFLRFLGYKVINFDYYPVSFKIFKACLCGNITNIIVKRIESVHRGYLFTCMCDKCGAHSKLSYNPETTIKSWNKGEIEKLENRRNYK